MCECVSVEGMEWSVRNDVACFFHMHVWSGVCKCGVECEKCDVWGGRVKITIREEECCHFSSTSPFSGVFGEFEKCKPQAGHPTARIH